MSQTSSFSRLQELLPQLFQSTHVTGNPYLRLKLNTEISVLMSMEDISESLLVPADKISPIPGMPTAVIGLMNSRDSVFCVIDLGELMGLSPLSEYLRQYHVIVTRVSQWLPQSNSAEKELLLGFAVNEIQGISRLKPEQMLRDENISEELLPENMAIDQIQVMVNVMSDEILPDEDIAKQLLPENLTKDFSLYFRKCFSEKEEELMVLDLQTIVQKAIKSII